MVEREPTLFTRFEIFLVNNDIPLAQFVVAFRGVPWIDFDSIALMVL